MTRQRNTDELSGAESSQQKAEWIHAYWAKRLGPFFDITAPDPRRNPSSGRDYYDDMLFLQVMDEIADRKIMS